MKRLLMALAGALVLGLTGCGTIQGEALPQTDLPVIGQERETRTPREVLPRTDVPVIGPEAAGNRRPR